MASSCTPTREDWGGQANRQTKVKEVTSSMSVLLPRPPSSSPSGFSRPGHTAPLRFGPGSRSCDVISKASALPLDTQPCPAGPSAQVLFTKPGRGEGRRNGPVLLQAGRSRPHPYGVSTCSWVRAATYGTGREPVSFSPPPRPPVPSTLCHSVWQHASLQYCYILQFPRACKTKGGKEKAVPVGLAGSGGKRYVQDRTGGHRQNVKALSNVIDPEAVESGIFPPAPPQQHPKGAALATPPGRPGCQLRPLPPPGGKIGGDQ